MHEKISINNKNDALISRIELQIDGYQTTALLYIASKLKIMDILVDGPHDIIYICNWLKSDLSTTYRILRALSSLGYCREFTKENFELTDMGKLLLTDATYPLYEKVIIAVEQYLSSWENLIYSVKTGKPAFNYLHGCSPWEFRQNHKDLNTHFNYWMKHETEINTDSILSSIDFPDECVIADIGGGGGGLLIPILKKYSNNKGILFDQKHVIDQFNIECATLKVFDRIATISGNFFKPFSISADIFILKSILHDWDDDQCIEILKNCKKTMNNGSRIMIIERLVDYDKTSSTNMVDIMMLAITGGKERTLDEYKSLMRLSGIRFDRMNSTSTHFYIIEGTIAE